MNGLLLINKPKGLTSHDVVDRIRKITKIKKVGHTGTLDPNASGLLVICIGEATKLIPYIEDANKAYEAKVVFGKKTSTDDIEGEVLEQKAVDNLNLNEFKSILNNFIGDLNQIPPIYSAKKVNGKKLYEYARKNVPVEIKPSKVTVNNIEILNTKNFPNSIDLLIDCSKGTYIRSLARDIGESLNNYAFLSELKRIKNNGFNLEESIDLASLTSDNIQDYLKPIELITKNLKSVIVKSESEKFLKNGNLLIQKNIQNDLNEYNENETVALILNNRLYGIGKIIKKSDKISIQPKKLLNID